jgi:C-terminal processing protease CtpA/Prc
MSEMTTSRQLPRIQTASDQTWRKHVRNHRYSNRDPKLRLLLLSILLVLAISQALAQQSNFTPDRARYMLEMIKIDIKKNYYDPGFHGIDLDARFKTADEKLKTAASAGQMLAIIAQVLLDFDDSHLYFMPPGRARKTDYGWEMQSVGDNVYISAVKPGSDGEVKGLKPGDRVISVNGYEPTRENLWKIEYLLKALKPQPGLRLVVESPEGRQRQLDVMAKVKERMLVTDLTNQVNINDRRREAQNEDRYYRSRWVTVNEELLIWKLPSFSVEESAISPMIGRAKKHKALILDLRGNGGGYVTTLEKLVGSFFDKEVLISEDKGRKEVKQSKSKRSGGHYPGKLIVLIDNASASASEVFARVVQIEKRGTVIGDRSAGAVMQSRIFDHELGVTTVIFFGASITNADVIMSDGKSLEKIGVTPDERLLPTAADLAARRDPVLAHAASLAGVKLEPEKAGSLFPIEWRK